VFVPGKHFLPSTILVDKASGLPKSGASVRFSAWVSYGPNGKHDTRLGRLAGDQPSSLLRTCLNYGHKKFYKIGPRTTSKSL
jgi:hypothetical protein